MSDTVLAALEAHVAAVEALGFDDPAIDDAGTGVPVGPDLAGVTLQPGDLDRARALLDRLGRAEARLQGMQRRLQGELAAARRPRFDAARPSPRVLDTSA